ncbi:transmembrane protein 179-like [Ruditapes philippinarum]|uniref:transmembrane protein 179-like n=1 Tax=Ruditapes philippinarum TaxID=129788 RepID=UPI00295BA915|nr:transmembrane protein 179-like [Ruditapes philippinarum]
MAMIDFHILCQSLLYFAAFVAGFAISIPVGVNRINFQGQCILYADFKWNNATSFVMTGSSSVNCNFPIYFSVFGLIFYGLGTGLYNLYAVIRSMKDPEIGSQMWVMPFILVNTLLAFTTMIVACVLSVGFLQFCEGLTKKTVRSCFSQENKMWHNKAKDKMFDSGPYYKLITVAQVAAWTCVLVFILQIVLSVLRFIRNRRRRSAQMFNEAQKDHTSSDTSRIAELEPTA